MKRFLIYLVLLLQTFFAACAFAAPPIPPRPSAGSGIYVQDYAGVINDTDKQKILSIGQDLDNKTTAPVAVLTINSLEGESIEDYALAVLRNWGVGNKEKNNGVLIVVAVKDRKSRIEVGYGLEGVLPDGKTGRIQDDYMLPHFKKNDYSKGIIQGYAVTAATIAKSEGVELSGVKYTGGAKKSANSADYDVSIMDYIYFGLPILAFLLIDNLLLGSFFTRLILLLFLGGGNHGGRGGGGGGFGGGSGGGGGSSRSW